MTVTMVAAGGMTVAGLPVGAPAAGATSTSGTAVATASSAAELQAQYAGQYDLYNLTDQVLTVDSACGDRDDRDGIAPAAGKKIYPGQKLHFGVNAKGTSRTDAGSVYLRVGQSKSNVVAMAKPSFSVGLRDSRVDYEPLRESGMDFGDSAFTVTPGGSNRSNLTVTNTKVRMHTLSADNAAAQLETLREISANDSSAQCAFTPTAYTDALTAPKLTGGVLKNNGATTVDRQHGRKSVRATTRSQRGVQAGLSANVLNMVTTTFSSTYTKTVTRHVRGRLHDDRARDPRMGIVGDV